MTIFTLVLLLYPREFRDRFGAAMAVAFREQMAHRRRERGRLSAVTLAMTSLFSTAANGLAERRAGAARRRTHRVGASWKPQVRQDLLFAIRMMRRQPIITMLSVISLSIGIAATTAAFGVVDASLIRALPLPAPHQLVTVMETTEGVATQVSYENLRDWQRLTHSFEALSALRGQTVNVTGLATPTRLRGGFVSSAFFRVAGVQPAKGRALDANDELPSATPVVVINHSIWQGMLGGVPDILGRTLSLNNISFTIVGVMPNGFIFPVDGPDAWIPVQFFTGTLNRSARSLMVVGRLAGDTSVTAAQAELDAVAAALAREYPDVNKDRGARIVPLHEWLTDSSRDQLRLVFALAIVLLGAACANVTSLQIGATMRRRQEIGVRVALGAGRARIAWQLITEHLLLAAIAGAIGLGLARAILGLLVASPLQIFGLTRAGIDVRVMLFVAGVTVAAGLVSGCVPALHWAAGRPVDHLRGAGRATADRRLSYVRGLLVAAQVGMSALLLTTTVFLVKSALATSRIDPGFKGEHVQTLEYRLPANKYGDKRQQALFHETVVAEAGKVPGVRHAAVVRGLPLSGNGDLIGVRIAGMSDTEDSRPVWFNTVTDDYFQILHIPLIDGRTFDRRDTSEAPLVAVVSQTFANRMWPGEQPVGREFEVAGLKIKAQVIGVVGDVRQFQLTDEIQPAVYARSAQNPGIFMTLIVETAGDPDVVRAGLRQAVWRVDADQPVWKERSLQSLLDLELSESRYLSAALAVLAIASVLLVTAGLYGVVSQSVVMRAREIGIRMVFGASAATVLRQILTSAIRLTIAGLLPGVGAAVLVSGWMRSYLYGASPLDVMPYVTASLFLIGIALVACYLPARRATAVDPVAAIRD